MKTGETVTELGLYVTECCSDELTFDVGDTFSRCPKCQALCLWEFQDEVVTSEDRKNSDGIAA